MRLPAKNELTHLNGKIDIFRGDWATLREFAE